MFVTGATAIGLCLVGCWQTSSGRLTSDMETTLAEQLERTSARLRRSAAGAAAALGLVACSTQPTIEEEAACAARGGTMVTSTMTVAAFCFVAATVTKPPKGEPQYEAGGANAHLGMTTNERLGYFGLLEDFERSAKARDRDGMIAALQGAKFDRQAAEGIADGTLANPAMYGF